MLRKYLSGLKNMVWHRSFFSIDPDWTFIVHFSDAVMQCSFF